MFLVEPKSGQRCHYGSARALGAAIRRGELGAGARIFHQRTNRWLPITVHPEYRRAAADREERTAAQWRERPWTWLAERPVHDAVADTFQPIPNRSSSTLVLLPPRGGRSWLGTLRRLLPFA
jgi:hypothetical protein